MQGNSGRFARSNWAAMLALLLISVSLALALASCSGEDSAPQVVVVTATYTREPVVIVVTATYTPPPGPLATATLIPLGGTLQAPETQGEAARAITDTVELAATASGPTANETVPVAAATASGPKATQALPPSATLQPPATATPPPAQATAKPTSKPASKPVSLNSYYVVYTAYKGPDLQDYSLWGMNGDGSGAEQIEGAGQASEPDFSPDGKRFAFYHWFDGIYVWNLTKQTWLDVVNNVNSSWPAWSPNGQRLAYGNLEGQPWIQIINADKTDDHRLTPGLRPDWSLNGGFIAYDTCENNKCGIFRINPDGKGKRQLTADSGGGPAVSPDGQKIAYWSKADGDFEIWIINADGSGKRQLTKNSGNDALPAWSPDGTYIYYLSDQNGTAWAVMVMDAAGGGQKRVIKTSAGADPQRGWQYQRITVAWNN